MYSEEMGILRGQPVEEKKKQLSWTGWSYCVGANGPLMPWGSLQHGLERQWGGGLGATPGSALTESCVQK